MAWATQDLVENWLGLPGAVTPPAEGPRRNVLLTGSAADPNTGILLNLVSRTEFDAEGRVIVAIDFIHHLPYGATLRQALLRMRFAPTAGGADAPVEISEIQMQSDSVLKTVFDRKKDNLASEAAAANVNRATELARLVNGGLADHKPVNDIFAKIFEDKQIDDLLLGQRIEVRSMNRDGAFVPQFLTSVFMNALKGKNPAPLEFRGIDEEELKTFLGFSVNTFDPMRNHTGDRAALGTEVKSGVAYRAEVQWTEHGSDRVLEMYIDPISVPRPASEEERARRSVLRLAFKKKGKDAFTLKEAMFLGQRIDPTDIEAALGVIGITQEANHDLGRREYPAFLEYAAQFDMLDMVTPLPTPRSLEKNGGEMLHVSLHGTGTEKKVENFGDQIGVASLFLHRGTTDKGETSTAAVAVDFPFASGGPDSGYDCAVPNYLPFLKDIKAFFITHDHYDHDGGLIYYIRQGLLKDKVVYAEPRVIYKIQQGLGEIDRRKWPLFKPLPQGTGATPVYDDEGNIRFWVQHCTNATQHSSLCTPYIVTGCYNDLHYNASVLLYGDARGIVPGKEKFFSDGVSALPELAKAQGLKVTARRLPGHESFDKKGPERKTVTLVLHDTTSVREEGASPTVEEVQANWETLFGLFDGQGLIVAPISTNHMEYALALDVAASAAAQRNITAVGANAELRLRNLNIHGVDPDVDLTTLRLSLEEGGERISRGVRAAYKQFLADKNSLLKKLKLNDVPEKDWPPQKAKRFAKGVLDLRLFHKESFVSGIGAPPHPGFRSVEAHLLDSLMEHGVVTFPDNNLNAALLYRALLAQKPWAPRHATRTSATAKDFCDDPGAHLIMTTGTQGTMEERFSTLQKFTDSFSLLDADPRVRKTGYPVKPGAYAVFVPQSSIPGNEDSQRAMLEKLSNNRKITVVAAFKDGFNIYAPDPAQRQTLLNRLRQKNLSCAVDHNGTLSVYSCPVHLNGHGRRKDIETMARTVNAFVHAPHHIPNEEAVAFFNQLMESHRLHHPSEPPDDYKVSRLDGHAADAKAAVQTVARLNPSYILVRMVRKYGHFFGGAQEFYPTTLIANDGPGSEEGLRVSVPGKGVYRIRTRQETYNSVAKTISPVRRSRIGGPGNNDMQSENNAHLSLPLLGMRAGGARG